MAKIIDMSINKKIKQTLSETKSSKDKLITESLNTFKNLDLILEYYGGADNIPNLTKKQKLELSVTFLTEASNSMERGLLNEQLMDILKNLFGMGLNALPQAIIEPWVNSILTKLGMKDSFMKNFLVSAIVTNPGELMRAFRDCKAMTTLVAKSLVEATIMSLEKQKGFDGVGMALLRNSMGNAFRSQGFVKEVENQLSTIICQLFEKFTGKASNILNTVKDATAPAAPATV